MKNLSIVFSLIIILCSCSSQNSTSIIAPGVVDGDIVVIKSLVKGELTKLSLNEGDKIEADKIVAEVDSAKIRNSIDRIAIERSLIINKQKSLKNRIKLAVSNKNYLKKQYSRYKRLKKKNSVPGEKVEKLFVQLTEANTTFRELHTSLERTEIELKKLDNREKDLQLTLNDHIMTSPVNNGIILEKYLNRGEIVNPGSPVLEILNTDSLYIEVFLEESEANKLKTGDKVSVFADGLNKKFEGKITFFGKKAEFSPKYIISEKERKNLLFKVKIGIQSGNSHFRIGMPVTVEL